MFTPCYTSQPLQSWTAHRGSRARSACSILIFHLPQKTTFQICSFWSLDAPACAHTAASLLEYSTMNANTSIARRGARHSTAWWTCMLQCFHWWYTFASLHGRHVRSSIEQKVRTDGCAQQHGAVRCIQEHGAHAHISMVR
jgi:hypothetical protein